MTTPHPLTRFIRSSAVAMVALLAFAACDRQEVVAPQETITEQRAPAGPATISNANVVEVIARHDGPDYVFELSDDVIPSGWTTFELDNRSHSTHFAFLAKVPQEALDQAPDDMEFLDYWIESVTDPFQAVMDGIIAGEQNPFVHFGDMAPWFFEPGPTSRGGPGLVAGLGSTRTTVHLDEGTYIVECYVKDGDGQFHSARGMIATLEVTGDASRTPQPRATMDVRLSAGEIQADDEVRPGLHTVAVHFDEQTQYAHLLGHDVHLIRLDDWTIQETAEWMNWMTPEGLVSAEGMRGPRTFVGGTQTMTAGSTAYFTVRLEPGEYAWIAEVPADVEMWKTFTVPHGRTTGGR